MIIKRGAHATNTWGKKKQLSLFSSVSETRISAAVISGAQAEDLEDVSATLILEWLLSNVCGLVGAKYSIWDLAWHQVSLGAYSLCLQDLVSKCCKPGNIYEPRLEPFLQANYILQESSPGLLQAELTDNRCRKITQHTHFPFYHNY